MTYEEAMHALEAAGTAQNRKVYQRHGVPEPVFGVSYANLDKLKKQIKVDHALATALWASGNHDARVLATKIADPQQADDTLLDQWVTDLNNYVICDALSAYVAKTALAQTKMEQWVLAEEEWIGSTGWNVLAHLAMKDKKLPDAYFEAYLPQIEARIHQSKNRIRYAMNGALIALGLRSDALAEKAIAVAERIGTVAVDHGETGCKTPSAVEYIQKGRARKKK
ncbi:MAG: DNA alkylation repair protein [Gemmatimonadetes bacterium]|nr:MAG: DNA alkylation repair protein [Gemmatimonadota bacterium]